jgi:hypothetical protein
MATDLQIRVEGLPKFIGTLHLTPAKIKVAERLFLHEAAKTVKRWAEESARQEGGVARKASEDLEIAGPGVVRYGGKPYDMGAEFGSYQYHQFERWRGKGDDAGYFLWPAVRRFRDTALAELWLRETSAVLSDAFPD